MPLLLVALLLFPSTSPSVTHFHKITKRSIQFSIFKEYYGVFEHGRAKEAQADFLDAGEAWSGDLNDDGTDEILIMPGKWVCGTGGCTLFLFRKNEAGVDKLVATLAGPVGNARYDILPVVHRDYHDLRLSDYCYKWNGHTYVRYEAADYHQLSPSWFSRSDFWNANILWKAWYAGRSSMKFKPQWVSGMPDWTTPQGVEDSVSQVKWLATFKGAVYGVKNGRSFILVPTPDYLGANKLELKDGWLLVYAWDKPAPVARYNCRTRELWIDRKSIE